jgi:hypothetical protein
MARRIAKKQQEPEGLAARVSNLHRTYYISRTEVGDEALIDDEAEIELEAVIERISKRHRRHLNERISISLLSSKRYAPAERNLSAFFGLVTLRGQARSVYAYLPSEVFWQLPSLIDSSARVVELRFSPLARGSAELLSLYVAEKPFDADAMQS